MALSRLRRVAVAMASGALALALASSGALLPAQAVETPAPQGGEARVSPTSVKSGQDVSVWTSGWAPGTQLQAVVCGQNAVGGSSSCHLPSSVTAVSNAKGEASHTLTLRTPPKPCPCVIRVTTFTAPALAMNVPLDVIGHATQVVPEQEPVSYDIRVEDVGLEGRGGISALLGLGGETTMVITIANRGEQAIDAPPIKYGFGRGDVEPETTFSPDVKVPANGSVDVEVDLDVPLLAFGSHQAVAQWADGSGGVASGSISFYPVGALLFLLGGLASIVVFDLRRTGMGRLEKLLASTPGAHRFVDDDGSYPLPEIVYLEDIGGYLIKPTVLKNSKLVNKVQGRVSVDDLSKLVEGRGTAQFPDGQPAAAPAGGGGISEFLRNEISRRSNRDGSGSVGSGPGLNFFVRGEKRRNDSDGPTSGSGSVGSGPGLNFFVRQDRDRDV